MEPRNLTLELLKQIRDELVTTRTELGSLIDQTSLRIHEMSADLGGRLDQTDVRLSAVEDAMLDLAEQQRLVLQHLSALSDRYRAR